MMLSRNELSHLYDEKISRKIYKQIKENYIKLLEKLQEKFPKLRLKTPKMVKIVGIILIAGVVFSLL